MFQVFFYSFYFDCPSNIKVVTTSSKCEYKQWDSRTLGTANTEQYIFLQNKGIGYRERCEEGIYISVISYKKKRQSVPFCLPSCCQVLPSKGPILNRQKQKNDIIGMELLDKEPFNCFLQLSCFLTVLYVFICATVFCYMCRIVLRVLSLVFFVGRACNDEGFQKDP